MEYCCCCCCLVTKLWQTSLSFTIYQSSINVMSIESMMPANNLILCCPLSSCPQSFPVSGSFPVSLLFTSGGQSIGASVSATLLPIAFPRQEYWSGLLFPSPGDLHDPGIELESPTLASRFLSTEPPEQPPPTHIQPTKSCLWNNQSPPTLTFYL